MFDPATNTPPTLASNTEAFRQWRAESIGRGSTPELFARTSRGATQVHSRVEITHALGINSTVFGQWVRELRGDAALPDVRRKRHVTPLPAPPGQFVELMAADPQSIAPRCAAPVLPQASDNTVAQLVVELPNGTRIVARSAVCADQLLPHLCQSGASAGAGA